MVSGPSKHEEILGEQRRLPAEVPDEPQQSLCLLSSSTDPSTSNAFSPLAWLTTVYFQKHLAQKGREEEKTDIHATLSARMGWQYHIVNQEGALVVWLDLEVYGSSSTNNK